MSHVIYIILFDPAMEYLGPNITPPASHVAQKNENHGKKWPKLYGQNASTGCDRYHVTLIKLIYLRFNQVKHLLILC